jgi:hypothetical protein
MQGRLLVLARIPCTMRRVFSFSVELSVVKSPYNPRIKQFRFKRRVAKRYTPEWNGP